MFWKFFKVKRNGYAVYHKNRFLIAEAVYQKHKKQLDKCMHYLHKDKDLLIGIFAREQVLYLHRYISHEDIHKIKDIIEGNV